jgi:hypothetical protein
MKKIFLAIISLTLISFNTCDDNPVNGDNVKPGRRDYSWRVDTIDSPNNSFSCIWGSSPTDVWVGGKGGVTSYDRLWHFNT